MQQALFHRPMVKAGLFDPLSNIDRPILVPVERPIHFWLLVEQNRSHGEGRPIAQLRSDLADRPCATDQVTDPSECGGVEPSARCAGPAKQGSKPIERGFIDFVRE